MTDFDILAEMMKESVKQPLADNYGKNQVTLIESQNIDSKVTISGLPDDAIVIKADAFKSPDTVFAGTKGECKRADYVIIAESGNNKVILFIEMKGGEVENWEEIVQQLKGASCFVAYCREIGREFWGKRDFLDKYKHRFIGIVRINIPKRKTRIDPKSGIHDCPERLMKIQAPNYLHFKHLAGLNR
jgi:hypothetical protein